MYLQLIVYVLIISFTTSQYASIQLHSTSTCSDIPFMTIIQQANNQCQSYDDGTSSNENCPINKPFTVLSCSDRYCSVGCNFTTYTATQCINNGDNTYENLMCIDDYPLQPVGTYMSIIYEADTCEGQIVEIGIFPINICIDDGSGEFYYNTCDSNYIYETDCSDKNCKNCKTAVVQNSVGCITNDGSPNGQLITCVQPLPTSPPQTSLAKVIFPSITLILISVTFIC